MELEINMKLLHTLKLFSILLPTTCPNQVSLTRRHKHDVSILLSFVSSRSYLQLRTL